MSTGVHRTEITMNFAIISKQLEDYYEYSYNLAGCSSLIFCFECPKI